MTALAMDGDIEAEYRSHGTAIQQTHLARFQTGIQMDAPDSVRLEALLVHISQHLRDTAAVFLSTLEEQDNPSMYFVQMFLEDLGSAQQHSSMTIMAAGVHHAIHLGAADTGTSQVLLGLLDRQRIAVGTQQDSLTLAGSLAFQNGYNTAMGHYFILNAHASQFLTNAFNGLVLLVGQLRMLMEIPAHFHYIGIDFLCEFINFQFETPPYPFRPK